MGGCGSIEMQSLTIKCPYRLIGVVCLQFDSSFLSNCLICVSARNDLYIRKYVFWGGGEGCERTF